MKALIEFLAKSLVEHPDAVNVSERPGDAGSVIELVVAKEDVGRIIGREGKTIKAIRHVLAAASTKAKTKYSLVIQE